MAIFKQYSHIPTGGYEYSGEVNDQEVAIQWLRQAPAITKVPAPDKETGKFCGWASLDANNNIVRKIIIVNGK